MYTFHILTSPDRIERSAPADREWLDIQVQLVFYSTFKPMVLPGGGPLEAMGVQKLYEPSLTPILYVALAADVLGRVPLMPLFLLGNFTPTSPHGPHQLRQHRSARFPHTQADRCSQRVWQEGKQRV